MRIAAETIYQSLYVQSRGGLRCGRSSRKPRGKGAGRGQIEDMVMLSERPAEVADRAVPGHWEEDLIVGRTNRSYIGTLVERQTRFVMLAHLGRDCSTATVTAQIANQIKRLPGQLRLGLPGTRARRRFALAAGLQPNGLLRQYFPRAPA